MLELMLHGIYLCLKFLMVLIFCSCELFFNALRWSVHLTVLLYRFFWAFSIIFFVCISCNWFEGMNVRLVSSDWVDCLILMCVAGNRSMVLILGVLVTLTDNQSFDAKLNVTGFYSVSEFIVLSWQSPFKLMQTVTHVEVVHICFNWQMMLIVTIELH